MLLCLVGARFESIGRLFGGREFVTRLLAQFVGQRLERRNLGTDLLGIGNLALLCCIELLEEGVSRLENLGSDCTDVFCCLLQTFLGV